MSETCFQEHHVVLAFNEDCPLVEEILANRRSQLIESIRILINGCPSHARDYGFALEMEQRAIVTCEGARYNLWRMRADYELEFSRNRVLSQHKIQHFAAD